MPRSVVLVKAGVRVRDRNGCKGSAEASGVRVTMRSQFRLRYRIELKLRLG